MKNLGFVFLLIILLHIYFIIPFMILMIKMPKIKEARKKAQKSYNPMNYNLSSTEFLYSVDLTRSEVIEILSVPDYTGSIISNFDPVGMRLTLRHGTSEEVYLLIVKEYREGCIITAKQAGKSYNGGIRINPFFAERLGARGISHELYTEKNDPGSIYR